MPSNPTDQATLIALEKSAIEARKTKDAKFWDTFLADNFVGYGPSGKLDKTTAARHFTGLDCEINSYALSNEQLRQIDPNVSLLTYRLTVDGQCSGQSSAATIYIRDGDNWKAAFHAESAIVEPKATSTPPAIQQEQPTLDPETQTLLTAEIAIWEAWKDQDAAKLDPLTTPEMSFINIFGTYFPTKAEALKDWTSHGCKVTRVSVTNPFVTRLSPHVAVLTFSATADGTCFGQPIGPIWGTSVYRKTNDHWKWIFGINTPALTNPC